MTKAKSEKNAPNKSQKQDVGSKALKRLQIIVNNEIQTPEAIDRMKQDLNNANKIIHKCLDSFLDVLVQLAIVKEKELWKVGCDKQNKYFKTFEQYTESEFGFRRAYLSRLKKAGEAYKWLQDKDTEKASELPQHPAFYMALSEIPEK